jgi:hypothetical protein
VGKREKPADGELRMPLQLHVEALLHLSALVLIVSIAYLGLDKVHLEKDQFLEALNEAKEEAVNFARRCDIKPGEEPVKAAMFYRFPPIIKLKFYVICKIAETNKTIPMRGYRPVHLCLCLWYIPLHGYFTGRRDRFLILLIAAFSLVTFFYLTATAVWDLGWFPGDLTQWMPLESPSVLSMQWIPNRVLMTPIYWMYVGCAFWIIFSVAVTHRLQTIKVTTARLINAVDDHMKKSADDITRYALTKTEEAIARQ